MKFFMIVAISLATISFIGLEGTRCFYPDNKIEDRGVIAAGIIAAVLILLYVI